MPPPAPYRLCPLTDSRRMMSTPDGVMRHLSGPWPGSRHDQFMLHHSDLQQWILSHAPHPSGAMYSVYADAGYAQVPGILRPYADALIHTKHEAFNQAMASSRISVEWAFGEIVQRWASVQYKPSTKLLDGSKPAMTYYVAALLSNCVTCLRPGIISQYFDVCPPSLEEYISSLL